ncbi:hypothetical protein BJY19_001212 [Arthrobacter cupressi]|nr:hypothetical protein [Arthrobacter cupressi]
MGVDHSRQRERAGTVLADSRGGVDDACRFDPRDVAVLDEQVDRRRVMRQPHALHERIPHPKPPDLVTIVTLSRYTG